MPKMSVKASEIADPAELFERIVYRNERLRTRVHMHDDPVKFATHLAGRTASDLRRLGALLGYKPSAG